MYRALGSLGLIALITLTAATLATAFDLGSLLGGGKSQSSGPSMSDLMKGCEKGSNDQRIACYRDASAKAKTGSDACGKQASSATDGSLKKDFEMCRDEAKRASNVLLCIADGAAKGGKFDDLKKSCPASAGAKI